MKSITKSLLPFAAVAITLVSLSGNARADVPPPDACSDSASVGASCTNAGTNHDEPGTCENSSCPHSVPNADGGVTTGDEPCVLCIASDGGTVTDAGSGGDGGGAVTTRPDAGTDSTPASSSSGCSATPDSRDGATGFAMLVVGMIGLVLSRRKKSA
jgi:MYXO-CTERM domain-containing protein